MTKKLDRLKELETSLIETTDAAQIRRDLNLMVQSLTATLKGVLTVTKELAAELETLSAKKTTIKPKTKAKTAAARTAKKAINLDPK